MAIDHFGYLYAAIVGTGGLIGYLKAGSVPSLASGLVFGTALAISAYQTSENPNNYGLQLLTSSVLGGVMGSRYYKSRKIMPAGIITVLSIAMISRIGYRAVNNYMKT